MERVFRPRITHEEVDQMANDAAMPGSTIDPRSYRMPIKVLIGSSFGQVIEFYDFALYALTAVILAKQFFPSSNPTTELLAAFATFGVAFLIRPLGGVFFGSLGDRIGRRRVLVITLTTIGVATAAMGALPTHAQIGIWAPILLVALRLVQGFSAGGESGGAPAFVFEHAPRHRRGLWNNVVLTGTALPSVIAGTFTLLLSQAMSSADYESWGWRIPFFAALPLALFGLWIRNLTEESPEFERVRAANANKAMTPLQETWRNNKGRIGQAIVIMGLAGMCFYFVSGYFVAYVQTAGDLSRGQSLAVNALALGIFTVLLPTSGWISDKVGRRPMLIAGSIVIALVAIPCFRMVTSGHFGQSLAGEIIFVTALALYGGGSYPFFVEAFNTRTRFTSAAISYNVAVALFGGTAPFVGEWLVSKTGVEGAPGFYVAGIAALVLVFIFVAKVPETRPDGPVEQVSLGRA